MNCTANFKLQYTALKQMQSQYTAKINRKIQKVLSLSQKTIKIFIYLVTLLYLIGGVEAITVDNTCTFKSQGKLFTLTVLNRYTQENYYRKRINNQTQIVFNFCAPFTPKECTNQSSETPKAYSFVVNQVQSGVFVCEPYSSDSQISYFSFSYSTQNELKRLNLTMTQKPTDDNNQKSTDFILDCTPTGIDQPLYNIRSSSSLLNRLTIYGQSRYVCPVFELSGIWDVLTDNLFFFGVILFLVGFIMLFYGILMTHLMIFIAAYFLSFAALFGIFTAFLTPDSSSIAIYFSLLLILFLSTLIAYSLTKLVNVSIFFVGALLGFILAAIINSIFCKIFDVYSKWSMIIFQILLIIPFGLLTFKHSQQVIVLSTSIVGSYMVVRPFSWMFGGFPNEFTLYIMIENGQLKTLPSTFFLYLVFIIAIAILGAGYQILKIKRRRPGQQIQSNFMTQNVESHLDKIKDAVDRIITKVTPQTKLEEDYKKMKQMEEIYKNNTQFEVHFEQTAKTKERKSKQQNF